MRTILVLQILLSSLLVYSQQGETCVIIDASKEAGMFTIREVRSGRIQAFKPDALEGARLKVGDSIRAAFDSMKVVAVNGTPTSYTLLDAQPGDSCCMVVKVDTLGDTSFVKIIARNKATLENIYFNVPKSLATSLDTGRIVFTQPTHGYAMIATQGDSTSRRLFGFPLLQEKSE